MKGSARIKDIARRAGVSIGTVDRVLHNRGEVSKATYEKIQKIIGELDYRPNILASSLASKRGVVIAVLIPGSEGDDSYWSLPLKGMVRAVESLQQFGLAINTFFFNLEDPESYTDAAQELLLSDPDGVVLAPWVKREAREFIDVLESREIPYLFIDSTIDDCKPVSVVAQNSYQSGFLAAHLIDLAAHKKSNILLVHLSRNPDNAMHLLQRERGFAQYMKSRSSFEHTLFRIDLNGGGDNLFDHLKEMGVSPEQVDALFVTSSKVHLIARRFKELNIHPRIVGYDLIPSNVELLKAGVIDFLISQQPEKQGYNSIYLLFDALVKKMQVPAENFTSIDIITAENIDFYKEF